MDGGKDNFEDMDVGDAVQKQKEPTLSGSDRGEKAKSSLSLLCGDDDSVTVSLGAASELLAEDDPPATCLLYTSPSPRDRG